MDNNQPIFSWEERAERPSDKQPLLLLLPIGKDAEELVKEMSEYQKLYGVRAVDVRKYAPGELENKIKTGTLITIMHGVIETDGSFPFSEYEHADTLLNQANSLGHRVVVYLPASLEKETESEGEIHQKFVESLNAENAIVAYYEKLEDTKALICEFADRIQVDPDAAPYGSHTKEYNKILQVLGRNPGVTLQDPAAALQLLSDDPIENDDQDKLGFRTYADALAGLIDNPETDTPLVLAINARWGAGKSSLGRMLKNRLLEKAAAGGNVPHVTCWFNAWMHDDATSLAGALTAEIARHTHARLPFFRRMFSPLSWSLLAPSERMRRIKHRTAAMFIIAVALSLLCIFYQKGPEICKMFDANSWFRAKCIEYQIVDASDSHPPESAGVVAQGAAAKKQDDAKAQKQDNAAGDNKGNTKVEIKDNSEGNNNGQVNGHGIGIASLWVLIPSIALPLLSLLPQLNSVAQSVGSFVGSPTGESGTGSMQQVRDQLGYLIRRSTPPGSRFVIFLDDIERCHPPRCVNILEAVNQLLNHRDVVVVVLADMKAVAANVEIKYSGLAEKHDPGPVELPKADYPVYGRYYLQKIIQYQFDLPPLHPGEIQGMLNELSKPEKTREIKENAKSDQAPSDKKAENVRESLPPVTEDIEAAPGRELGLMQWLLHIAWRRDAKSGITLGIARKRYKRLPGFLYFPIDLALRPLIRGTRSGYPISQRGALDAPVIPGGIDYVLTASFIVHCLGSFLTALLLITTLVFQIINKFSRYVGNPSEFITLFIGSLIVWFIWIMVLHLPVYVLSFARARTHRWRQDMLRGAARKQGRSMPAENNSLVSENRQKQKKPSIDSASARRYIEEQRHLRLINDSRQLAEALTELIEALPVLPRNAKRLLNRLRVYLLLTELRGLLGDVDGKIRPTSVGRWVLLQERWPELADGLRVRPHIFSELFSAAKRNNGAQAQKDKEDQISMKKPEDEYISILSKLTSLYHEDSRLRKFLAESHPLTGGVLDRLVLLRESS